ncbi:MAG: CBS domain-containing protein [Candidatus Bathyarchaeia archaeon]
MVQNERKPAGELLRSFMTPFVITVASSEPVRRALELMNGNDVGSIVVVEKGAPVGIITERDISKQMMNKPDLLNLPANNVMSTPVLTSNPDLPVWKAVEVMTKRGIRRLPLVNDNKLVGIVTEKDIFKWIVKQNFEP